MCGISEEPGTTDFDTVSEDNGKKAFTSKVYYSKNGMTFDYLQIYKCMITQRIELDKRRQMIFV